MGSALLYNDSRIGGQCKGCPDRTIEPVNCHTYCEKYLEATRKWQEYKHNIDQARKTDYEYDRLKQYTVTRTKDFMKKHKPKIK